MRTGLVGALLVGGVLLLPDAAAAQHSSAITVDRGSFAIVPFAGYLVSENFVEGPLNTSLGGTGAALYGVQAGLPLAPGASIVGTVGYSSGSLEVGLPLLGGVSVGDNRVLLLDAGVELRLDSWETRGRRLVPLMQFGGGALRREVSVIGLTAKTTDFMVSGGIGADVLLGSGMALRIMAKDHYGKADFGTVGPLSAKTDDLHTLALSAGLRFAF